MPRPLLLPLVLALGAGAPLAAQGVLVAPHAIYIDHARRSGTVTLYNPNRDPAEVTISTAFGYPVTDSLGHFALRTVEPPDSTLPAAAAWVQAFPRRLTIAPLQRQTVRLLATPPTGLPDGEYWARLIISARGGRLPVAGVGDTAAVRVPLNLVVNTNIGLAYRKGPVATGGALSKLRARPVGGSVEVWSRLERRGAAAGVAASRGAAAVVPPGSVAPDSARDSLKAFRAQNESPDSEPEPVLVELQIGRAASRTVSAYRVGAEALLPVTALLQLGEAGYRMSLDGRLEATVNPGSRRLLIDVGRDTMSLGARRVGIEPAYRFFHDNELYVGARRLGELLESRILVDWGELSVTLMDDGKLPIGRRLRREAARAAFLERTRGVPPERAFALERPRWNGLGVDY